MSASRIERPTPVQERQIMRLGRLLMVFTLISGTLTAAMYPVTRRLLETPGELELALPGLPMLVLAAIQWFASLSFFVVIRLVRRGAVRLAGRLFMFNLALFPITGLFWGGAFFGVALTLASAGAITVIARLVLPGDRRGLAWVLGVLGALLAAFSSWVPLRPGVRLDIGRAWWLTAFAYLMVGGLLALLVSELSRAYRRILAIRTRLLVTIVAIVLLVAVVITVSSTVINVRGAQTQSYAQLSSVATLKEEALATWTGSLQSELDTLIAEDYEFQRAIALLQGSFSLDFQQSARQTLRLRFQRIINNTGHFEELFLMNFDGEVVLSTVPTEEGKIYRYAPFFRRGLVGPYVDRPRYDLSREEMVLILVKPLDDQLGHVVGLVGGYANMEELNEILVRAPMGETGETLLVAPNHVLLNRSRFVDNFVASGEEDSSPSSAEIPPFLYVYSEGALRALSGINSQGSYIDYRGEPVLGIYRWLPEMGAALLTEIDQAEVLSGAQVTIVVNTAVAVVASGLAALIAVYFARDIALPLAELADTATRIAAGERALRAPVVREDEIGAVAQAFNSMTAQLRDLITGLEQRVAERTEGLQAVTEVSRATISVLDLEALLPQVVELVREHFDLYYVGLFLVDEESDIVSQMPAPSPGAPGETWAVLRAGSGEAGREMLAEDWRLRVGGASMIGQCVATGQVRVKQTEHDVSVRFDNPHLPDTRSELALPLRYGTEIIGAMTVQSTREAAFDDTAIALLQNMADQVAVAVENARLFAETQAALEQAQAVQQRYLGRAWHEYLRARAVRGYEQRGMELTPLGSELLPEVRAALRNREDSGSALAEGDGQGLQVPIRQGEQVVGVLGFEGKAGGWTSEEVALVEALAEQLSLAAETQRLLDQTQSRAVRERLLREITDAMGRAADMPSLLRITAEELNRHLGGSRAYVRLTSPEGLSPNGGGLSPDEGGLSPNEVVGGLSPDEGEGRSDNV